MVKAPVQQGFDSGGGPADASGIGKEDKMTKLLLLTAALWAAASADAAPGHGSAKNPNDMICREIGVTGSRLDVKRICMTRLQWDEQRRDAREAVDRTQTQQVNPKG